MPDKDKKLKKKVTDRSGEEARRSRRKRKEAPEFSGLPNSKRQVPLTGIQTVQTQQTSATTSTSSSETSDIEENQLAVTTPQVHNLRPPLHTSTPVADSSINNNSRFDFENYRPRVQIDEDNRLVQTLPDDPA